MGLRALKVRLVAIMVVTGFCVTAAVATAALVSVRSSQNSSLGAILVSSSGRTLYHLSSEKGTIKCTGTCAAEWPPLLIGAGAKPIAQPGVTASLLGTIKRPDGKIQVTYHGLALYTYSGDKKAGDVKGQGAGGIWHAIAPSGAIITKAVSTSTSTGTDVGLQHERRLRVGVELRQRLERQLRLELRRQRRRRHLYAAGRLRHEPRRLRLHVAPTRASAVLAGRDDMRRPGPSHL